MSIWYAIPSVLSAADFEEFARPWRVAGYKLAVFRDPGSQPVNADLVATGEYRGYANAVNLLCRAILRADPGAKMIGTGGDDHRPPTVNNVTIAPDVLRIAMFNKFPDGYGVLQPTGDRYGALEPDVPLAATSPWFGRAWCERAYQGKGPLCEEYFHFFVDGEVRDVAIAHNALLEVREIVQFHDHHERAGRARPKHLTRAKADWSRARDLYYRRKAANFPGSEQLCQ